MTARVRAGGLRGYSELVEELGGNPAKLTAACNINHELLGDEDALVSYRSIVHLMELTSKELQLPDLGLRLAAKQDIGILGTLAVAMQNCRSVEEACRCAATYLFMQSPALVFEIDKMPTSARLRLEINLSHLTHNSMCQTEDLGIGITFSNLRMLAEDRFKLLRVELPHPPLCSPSVYESYFNAPVVFSSDHNALYVTRETLSAPLTHRSEKLRQMAAAFLDLQSSPDDVGVAVKVETAIRRSLGTDSCDRESIARAMGMHSRTMQRHLKKEGTTFEVIRDTVRREMVEQYLYHSDMPISQIAALVGYSEQSILSRSCLRWFGKPPGSLRKSHVLDAN